MLTFVGLGLYDERSVTIRGQEAIRSSDRIFAEFYTSRLTGATISDLESTHDVDVEVRDRAGVENDPDQIFDAAESGDVAFLAAGDPMISTTHVDLRLRAIERGIETRVIHGTTASSAAASLTGLQNYRFGKATTVPFPYAHGGGRSTRARTGDEYTPTVPGSVLETIEDNRNRGLHTLAYLDIKVGIGPRGPDPDHEEYMTADFAAEMLAESLGEETLGVVVARAGSEAPLVRADRLDALVDEEFGDPLHLLVIPGELHHVEREALSVLGGASDDVLPTQ
ncbi:MAG: diphthine synthase [Natronomonas sp.]